MSTSGPSAYAPGWILSDARDYNLREAAARLPAEAEEPESLGEDEAIGEDEAEGEGADLDALSKEPTA